LSLAIGICYVVNKISLPSKFNVKLQTFQFSIFSGGPKFQVSAAGAGAGEGRFF
jgi:hypothetical protein